MKKKYINPELLVVKIQTMQMLAASGDEVINTAGNYDNGTGITLGSREDDFDWEDEE